MRRVLAILPLFLTALLVQIYAPVGSGLALGRAPDSLVFAAAPCSATSGAHESGAPHHPGAVCDLCEFVLSGAAPLASVPAAFAVRCASSRRMFWRSAAVLPAPTSPPRTARARAPPLAS